MYLRYKTVTLWQDYLREHSLLKENQPLQELQNTRIGIDVNTWLRQMITIEEPFQPAMGGIPLTLREVIYKSLSDLEQANITPLFVFSGISLDHNPFVGPKSLTSTQREAGWKHYQNGSLDKARECFSHSDSATIFIRNLFPIFIEKNVQYMQAPYSAGAQLCWFHQKGIIKAVYGAVDLLPFTGTQKIITSFNFHTRTYTWCSRKDVESKLSLTSAQFTDLFVLSSVLPKFNIDEVSVRVKNNESGQYIAQNKADEYLSKKTFTHTPILDHNCQCEPLETFNSPKDLHEIFGSRFPSELYLFLSQGILSTQAVQPLAFHSLYEAAPLVDTTLYHQVLDALNAVRSFTLNILTFQLPNQFAKHPVKIVRWYDRISPFLQVANERATVSHLKASVTLSDVEKEKVQFNTAAERLQFALAFVPQRETTISKTPINIPTKEHAIEQILLLSLQALQYINSQNELLPYGKALAVMQSHHDLGLLVLELFRVKALNVKPFNYVDVGNIAPPLQPEVALISRVFSLYAMRFTSQPWNQAVDLDLIAFNSIVKVVNRSVRTLLEALVIFLYTQTKIQFPLTDFTSIAFSLPYFQESNTAAGIIIKHFLNTNQTKEQLVAAFPCCSHLVEDLQQAFKFWDQVVIMVKHFSDSNPDLVAEFQQADAFLSTKRQRLN